MLQDIPSSSFRFKCSLCCINQTMPSYLGCFRPDRFHQDSFFAANKIAAYIF